jgi:hypothetical protein
MARMPLLVFVSACLHGLEGNRIVERVEVDMLEVNTVYDQGCKPVFVQVIAWQYMVEDNDRPHNVGWRMVSTHQDLPVRIGSSWSLAIFEAKRVLKVVAPYLRRTWTQVDPERADSRDWWHGNPPNIFQDQPKESR